MRSQLAAARGQHGVLAFQRCADRRAKLRVGNVMA
jgi:hypothetical protein